MRKLRRFARWGALIVALLALFWLAANWYFKLRFESAVRELAVSGQVVELADLNRAPVPKAENAAPLLIEARDWVEEHGLADCSATYDIEWSGEHSDIDTEVEAWDEVEDWIEALEPFYEKVEQAMKRPACDFGIDYRQGWDTIVESLPISSLIAESYNWRVRRSQHRGDPAMPSLSDCVLVLDWSARSDKESLIGYFVAGAVDGVACEMIRRVASMRDFDAVEARGILDPILDGHEADSSYRRALQGERAMLIHAARRLATWDGAADIRAAAAIGEREGDGWHFRCAVTALRPLVWRDGSRALSNWNTALGIIETGGPSAEAALAALAAQSDWETRADAVPPMWRFLSISYRSLPRRFWKERRRHLAR